MPRRAWYLILAELAVILFLASSLVMEYFYNVYFHNYVDSLSPILIPLASVAFGVSSATIAVRLYVGTRRIQTAQEETRVPVRRRSTSLRTRRKTLTPTSPPQNPTPSGPVDASKKKPEPKPDQKPAPAAASPPKPAAPPSPVGTLPPRVQPEKEAKPHSDKSG